MEDRRLSIVHVWLLLLVAVSGVACDGTSSEPTTPSPAPESAAEQTDTVSFTTVAHDAPLGDEPAEAAYAVIGAPQGWERAAERLPDDAVAAGRDAGDDRVFFVAFAGAKASSGYRITIASIEVQGDDLVVTVEQESPGEDEIVEPAMTVPFHVVAVADDALPEGVTAVRFRDGGGQTLAEKAYPVP